MYQIRRGVFETNSSSSHSISISCSDHFSDLFANVVKGGVVYGTGLEFGWGYDIYSSANIKLQYLITGIFSSCSSQLDVEDKKENNSYYKMLKDVIKEYTNYELKIVDFDNIKEKKYYPYGYIDHQSYGEYAMAFDSKNTLANFLFNPQSTLIIDNDNH
jgi:hypothetical protein